MRPFSNGTQYMDWVGANCDRCTKGAHRLGPDALPDCEIELALGEALCGDGSVTDEIAWRMGYYPDGSYCWMCSEWNPTKEWSAEWHRRRE